MTDPTYFYALCALAFGMALAIALLGFALITKQREIEELIDVLDVTIEARIRAVTEQADIITAVSPLLEKTDWMTGRWGGKFDVLVRMEERRNRIIDDVRRLVMSTYSVEQQIEEDPQSLIPTMNLVPGAHL